MQRTLAAGLACCALGLLGYVVGVYYAYPGRAFSVTAVMLGVTLLAVSDGPLLQGVRR